MIKDCPVAAAHKAYLQGAGKKEGRMFSVPPFLPASAFILLSVILIAVIPRRSMLSAIPCPASLFFWEELLFCRDIPMKWITF